MNGHFQHNDDRYYSTQELAKLLRVNEATIRRWADSGTLKCFKTPGGHRKFTPEHVSEFISEYHYDLLPYDSSTPPEVPDEILNSLLIKEDYRALSNVYSAQALRANKKRLVNLLGLCHLREVPLVDVYDEIVVQGIRNILSLELQGKITAAEEQLASNAMLESLQEFRLLAPKNSGSARNDSANGRVAICGSLTGGLPEVILLGVSHLLEVVGWNVHNLGSNPALEVLTAALESYSPALVCSAYDSLTTQAELIDETHPLLDAAESLGTHVLLWSFEPPQQISGKNGTPQKKWVIFSTFREMLSLVGQVDS